MRPEEPGADRPFGIDQYPEHFNKPAQHHHYPHPDCAECQATLKRRKEEVLAPPSKRERPRQIHDYNVTHRTDGGMDQALRIIGYGFFSIGIGIIVAAALFVTYLNGQ